MIEFTIDTEITRTPAEVFAYVTDPTKLATWQTNTISAVAEDDGPLGLRSRLHEVHRAPGGKQLASVVEVGEFEPDRVFALDMVEGALSLNARMTFEPTAAGTRFEFSARGQPTGWMRIAQPILRRTLKRQFAANCARLKQVLEATPSGS